MRWIVNFIGLAGNRHKIVQFTHTVGMEKARDQYVGFRIVKLLAAEGFLGRDLKVAAPLVVENGAEHTR